LIPPRRDSLDDARRRLDEAAGAIDDMRRLTGTGESAGAPAVSASERVRSDALAAARDALRRTATDLEAARAQGALLLVEVGRLREELAARPTASALAEALVEGESDAARRAAELGKQVAVLQERVTLLSAEHVRLETLRRKAESFGANSEAARRSLEETLRRDLLAAHASLDRAAAESGIRDAKAITEITEMRKRLDAALSRLQHDERENLVLKQANAEKSVSNLDFEAAQAVIAALRRELSEQRADALGRENALGLRVHELERRLTEALTPQGTALLEEVGRLREELASRPTGGAHKEALAAVETMRRDLLAAHAARAALDREAAESGAREANEAVEIAELRKRLDSVLARLHLEESALKQASAAGSALRDELEGAQGVIASLRQESAQRRAEALVRERALAQAAAESGAREAKALAGFEEMRKRLDLAELSRTQAGAAESSFRDELLAAQGVVASLRRELAEQRAQALIRERALTRDIAELSRTNAPEASLRENLLAAQGLIASLRLELAEQRAEAPPAGTELQYPVGEETAVEYPPMEFALEPGWARLFRLVKAPLQSAYGHLRRLSMGPMSAGQRAILRLTGSSLSQAADALATIDLALTDSPATTETTPVFPVLESALTAWEAVFRSRGIVLERELSRALPVSPHDPEQLRLALHHVLRNAVEALPRGATLRVHLGKSATDAVVLEFRDDGPGFPAAWLERQFEPFASPRQGHVGLGLAAVRRALRRWGGDASASAAASGRGACLTLAFAASPARPALKE